MRVSACLLMTAVVVRSAAAVELPQPDLSALEPAVAEQLAEVREMAATVVGNSLAPAADKAKAWADMAQLFHAYDLLDAADTCYLQAEALDPGNADWTYYRAHVAVASGDLESAAGHFARVLERRPQDLPSLIHLADLEQRLGRGAQAGILLDRAAAADPSAPVVWARQGELALAEGRHQEAVALLTAALEAVPAANRLHHPLGLAYRGLGDLDRARHHLALRGDVGLAPADPLRDELARVQVGERVHLLRGRRAFQAGSLDEAAKEFQLAVEAQPGSVPARINLSVALAGLGEVDAAARELLEVVELAPDNPTARFNLGMLLADGGRHQLAVVELAEASRLRPEDEDAWLAEAKSWIAMGAFHQAAHRLGVAIATLSESGRIAFALAKLLAAAPELEVRDGERALGLAERVFAAQRSVAHGELVGLALRELGRCDEARRWLEQLIDQGEAVDAATEVEQLRALRTAVGETETCRP